MPEFEVTMHDVENLGTSGGEGKEFAGATEIRNFEGCTLLGNQEMANYLKENLPPSHLENCPSIEYDPNHEIFNDPEVLGFYECDSHVIHIADETRFRGGKEDMIDTVTHEIGHHAYIKLIETDPRLVAQWTQLYADSWPQFMAEGTGFVSPYAMTSRYEDFAESYRAYVRDPESLQFLSPEKYAFLHDYIFAGREYLPT